MLPVSDTLVVSDLMDAVILVAAAGSTTKKEAHRAFELLSQVDAPVIGTVLNSGPGQSGYGYGYGNNYSYGDRPARTTERRGSGVQRHGPPPPRRHLRRRVPQLPALTPVQRPRATTTPAAVEHVEPVGRDERVEHVLDGVRRVVVQLDHEAATAVEQAGPVVDEVPLGPLDVADEGVAVGDVVGGEQSRQGHGRHGDGGAGSSALGGEVGVLGLVADDEIDLRTVEVADRRVDDRDLTRATVIVECGAERIADRARGWPRPRGSGRRRPARAPRARP